MSRSIAKNALYNMGYRAVLAVFPLITTTYVSHILGSENVGKVASAQNLVTYFVLIATLGIPAYGVRAIAQSKTDKKKCNKVFTELFIINFFSTLFALVCYYIYIRLAETHIDKSLSCIFASLIVLCFFNIEWLFQGFEEYGYITLRSIIVKMISLIALFVFVKNKNDIIPYSIIVCFGTGGNYLLNIANIKKHVSFDFTSIRVQTHIRRIFIFFATVIAIEIYTLLDVTMLTRMCAPSNVGYYSNASKIVKTIANTVTALGAVLLPRLSVYFNRENEQQIKILIERFYNAITTISIPCFIGVIICSEEIVTVLFGSDFLPSIWTIKWLSFLILLLPLSGGIFAQILQTSNNEKTYFFVVCIGALANIILNYIFIQGFQHNGAAIASVLTEACVNIGMILKCQKIIRINYMNKEVLRCFFAGLVMMCPIILIKCFMQINSITIKLVAEILIGAVVYAALLVLFKNSTITLMISKVRKYTSK